MRIYRRRKVPARTVVVIIIILILILKPSFFLHINAFVQTIFTKPLDLFSGTREYFVNIEALKKENTALKERLANLSIELARLHDIEQENERLIRLLQLKHSFRFKTIVSRVIGYDSSDWRRSILVDKGFNDGIKKGMSCLTFSGLVGRVVEVNKNSARVMLINDISSKIGVSLEDGRTNGILVGLPDGRCKVLYLPLDKKLETGTVIITSGESLISPSGIKVGIVVDTGIDRTKLYRYAIVQPSVNLDRIKEVLFVKK